MVPLLNTTLEVEHSPGMVWYQYQQQRPWVVMFNVAVAAAARQAESWIFASIVAGW